MKTKHLLFALAAPLFVAACTNEELVETSTVQNLGETISTENFTLRGGFAGAQSRMGFNGTKLSWWLDKTGVKTDQLGLCLALNGKAQTNYKWLVSELTAASGNVYKVNAGSFSPAAVAPSDINEVEIDGDILSAALAKNFVTENATIFTGTYVAYYPYDEEFYDASATIPVNVETIQVADGLDNYDYVGKYSFYVSDPFEIQGGDTEADFTMRQVLPIVKFNLKNEGNSNIEISKIELSADGKMPVSAGIDANLTSQVALSNIHVDTEKNADNVILSFSTPATVEKGKEKYAYMTVMPGTYKNLNVKVILKDGSFFERTIASVTTTLNQGPAINIPMDAEDTEAGSIYSQVASAADFQAALTAAATATTGTKEINIIRPIEVTDADFASTINGNAKVIIKGEKLTVTDAYNGTNALKNVFFNNEVEFTNTYTTNESDNVTFAGTTTFAGAVTVTDGSTLNIAGNATAKANVTVGTSTTAATLNINEGATLNMAGTALSYTGATSHAINVLGTLNLNNDATGTNGATLALPETSNEITISGTVNVNGKSTVTINQGKWYVGDGAINNAATLNIKSNTAIQGLARDEEPMTLTNTGEMTVANSNISWAKDKVTIVNNGLYTVTGLAYNEVNTVVANADNTYDGVNGIVASLATGNTYDVDVDYLDMSGFTLTFEVNATAAVTANIQIPATKAWRIGTLNVEVTGTNGATINIQSAGSTAAQGVTASIGSLNVTGSGNDYSKDKVVFAKNSAATVTAAITKMYVENASVIATDNSVACSTTPVTKGTVAITDVQY